MRHIPPSVVAVFVSHRTITVGHRQSAPKPIKVIRIARYPVPVFVILSTYQRAVRFPDVQIPVRRALLVNHGGNGSRRVIYEIIHVPGFVYQSSIAYLWPFPGIEEAGIATLDNPPEVAR